MKDGHPKWLDEWVTNHGYKEGQFADRNVLANGIVFRLNSEARELGKLLSGYPEDSPAAKYSHVISYGVVSYFLDNQIEPSDEITKDLYPTLITPELMSEYFPPSNVISQEALRLHAIRTAQASETLYPPTLKTSYLLAKMDEAEKIARERRVKTGIVFWDDDLYAELLRRTTNPEEYYRDSVFDNEKLKQLLLMCKEVELSKKPVSTAVLKVAVQGLVEYLVPEIVNAREVSVCQRIEQVWGIQFSPNNISETEQSIPVTVKSEVIRIPDVNWHTALAETIKTVEPGSTIAVHSEEMKELAERALQRMRPGEKINFVIEGDKPNQTP